MRDEICILNLKITKSTKLSEIINDYPRLAEILIVDYGLHCIDCQMAVFETLEQGAAAHGMDKQKIEKMVKKLNEALKPMKHSRQASYKKA